MRDRAQGRWGWAGRTGVTGLFCWTPGPGPAAKRPALGAGVNLVHVGSGGGRPSEEPRPKRGDGAVWAQDTVVFSTSRRPQEAEQL